MHVLTVPALLMCSAAAGAVGWTANRLSTGAGGPLLILPWASLAAVAGHVGSLSCAMRCFAIESWPTSSAPC